jgi:hypothetical protein
MCADSAKASARLSPLEETNYEGGRHQLEEEKTASPEESKRAEESGRMNDTKALADS